MITRRIMPKLYLVLRKGEVVAAVYAPTQWDAIQKLPRPWSNLEAKAINAEATAA